MTCRFSPAILARRRRVERCVSAAGTTSATPSAAVSTFHSMSVGGRAAAAVGSGGGPQELVRQSGPASEQVRQRAVEVHISPRSAASLAAG